MIGAVARNGLRRLYLGSTAEQVLGRLPCDMLIIKPSESPAIERRAQRVSEGRYGGTQLLTRTNQRRKLRIGRLRATRERDHTLRLWAGEAPLLFRFV